MLKGNHILWSQYRNLKDESRHCRPTDLVPVKQEQTFGTEFHSVLKNNNKSLDNDSASIMKVKCVLKDSEADNKSNSWTVYSHLHNILKCSTVGSIQESFKGEFICHYTPFPQSQASKN